MAVNKPKVSNTNKTLLIFVHGSNVRIYSPDITGPRLHQSSTAAVVISVYCAEAAVHSEHNTNNIKICASVFASSKTFGHVMQIGHVTAGTGTCVNLAGILMAAQGRIQKACLEACDWLAPPPNNDFFRLKRHIFGNFW